MIVSCRDQEEIDRYWSGLSAAPQAERCGWCVDRWGVSWQVVPHNIAELMADAATREKLLNMGKIDLAGLYAADLTTTVSVTCRQLFRITLVMWKPLMAYRSPTR